MLNPTDPNCYKQCWLLSYFFIVLYNPGLRLRFIVFNSTFLLVEESGVPGESHWPATINLQTLSHNVASSMLCHERGSNSEL